MSAIGFDIATTTNTAINLTWSAPTMGSATGGSSVALTGYKITWNQGNTINTWVTLVEVSELVLTYMKTALTDVTETYQFKILAQNKYGDGVAQTSSETIMTGQAPDAPSAPTTSIASGSIYVDILWTAPASDNNFAVDSYLVEILKADGTTWYEDTIYCDATDPTSAVYIAKECHIPMTVLRSTTYGLILADVVYAKV